MNSNSQSEAITLWGPIRSTLSNAFSFSDIKVIVGYAGLDMVKLAGLEQRPTGGATKGQLLSEIDRAVGAMDVDALSRFAAICCEEMLRLRGGTAGELDRVLSRVGWSFTNGTLVQNEIFSIEDLIPLTELSHQDLLKAASRLRDGDLSGALTAACGALDTATRDIYQRYGLGNEQHSSFQERIKRCMTALEIEEKFAAELKEIGWSPADIGPLTKNLTGSLNQAAYVMQNLRSGMGDVHGTKTVVSAVVYDAIKWSSLLLRILSIP